MSDNPWFQVDLAASYKVESVKIFGQDVVYTSNDLKNVEVRVGEDSVAATLVGAMIG